MAFEQRMSAVVKNEDTFGTFNLPLAADKDFVLEVGLINPEPNTAEGLRDSDGSFSRGQTFTQDITAKAEARTYLMEPVDATSATGKIEGAPVFEASGMRQSTWDDNGTEKLSLVFDGSANCQTMSMRAVNLACGTSQDGYGWDLRGIRTALEIAAEVSGGIITASVPISAAYESHTYDKTAAASVNAIDTDAQGKEQFQGAFVFDSVATPIDAFKISLNPTQKAKKDPSAEGGVSLNTSTDYDPMISITASAGTATSTWWADLLAGKVVDSATYTGTFVNIIVTGMSTRNHTPESAEGEIAITREMSFKTLEIQYK